MEFRLIIGLDGDAMQDAKNAASALEDVARHITRYGQSKTISS